jgi:hypothetical protein
LRERSCCSSPMMINHSKIRVYCFCELLTYVAERILESSVRVHYTCGISTCALRFCPVETVCKICQSWCFIYMV